MHAAETSTRPGGDDPGFDDGKTAIRRCKLYTTRMGNANTTMGNCFNRMGTGNTGMGNCLYEDGKH